MSRFLAISVIISLALLLQGCGETALEDTQPSLEDARPQNGTNREANDIASPKPSLVTTPLVSTDPKAKFEHLDYDVEYSISGDAVTQQFCSNLLNNFPTHLDQIISYNVKSLRAGLTDSQTSIPEISSILSTKKVDLQPVKWSKVSDIRKKDVYFNTFVPLKLKEYDRGGRIKNVSITTVEKWEKHFPLESQKYDYWESPISGSQYILYRRTNYGVSEPIWDINSKFNNQGIIKNFSVYIEFDGIALEQHPPARAVIKAKNDEKLFFISIYAGSEIDKSLGTIRVSTFQPSLVPGEKPFEIDHPWGNRKVSGPLRYFADDGCNFTVFHKQKSVNRGEIFD